MHVCIHVFACLSEIYIGVPCGEITGRVHEAMCMYYDIVSNEQAVTCILHSP